MITLHNKKTFVLSMSLVCLSNMYAAEQQGLLATYTGVTVPSWQELKSAGYNFVVSTTTSAVNTVGNQTSDTWAFAKLGFPPTNEVNKAELQKYLAIKDRYNNNIQKSNFTDATFEEDAAYLERRHGYCHRLVNAIKTHEQGTELAVFALQYYQPVMNSFEIARLLVFVQTKKEASEQAIKELNSQLSALSIDPVNSLVFSALKQSVVPQQGQQAEQFTFDMSKVVALLASPIEKALLQDNEGREDQKEAKE